MLLTQEKCANYNSHKLISAHLNWHVKSLATYGNILHSKVAIKNFYNSNRWNVLDSTIPFEIPLNWVTIFAVISHSCFTVRVQSQRLSFYMRLAEWKYTQQASSAARQFCVKYELIVGVTCRVLRALYVQDFGKGERPKLRLGGATKERQRRERQSNPLATWAPGPVPEGTKRSAMCSR